MNTFLATIPIMLFLAACATGPAAPSESLRSELAPKGVLRAAVNYGNPSIAQRDPAGGDPRGVGPDLARELARRLGVPIRYVTYPTAGQVADDAQRDVWDVAFLAIDPKRAESIAFSDAYVEIGGTYLVRNDSPLKRVDEFDRKGLRISVALGSGYDLYLSRTLKNVEFVRTADSPAAIDKFFDDRLDAVGGVRELLTRAAKERPGVRVIGENFMVIRQAAAVPKRSEAAARYLHAFIEEMKASGFVADAVKRSGSTDASVAPAAK
ncbi:MAG: transporter substrate-binding domain-containing protein [Usitatibacter sp.]